jgi:hypothetical protein
MAENESDWLDVSWRNLRSFIGLLKCHFRLLGAVALVLVVVAVLRFAAADRAYTAVAVIGPPAPSPTGTLMSAGGGSFSSSLSARLLGSAGSGQHDVYHDFQQLLPSTSLSQALIDRDQFLQIIYKSRWDEQSRQWKPPGTIRTAINTVKKSLGMPVVSTPGVDDLMSFFKTQLSVEHSAKEGNSLLGGESPYLIVSLTYADPDVAKALLSKVLLETDRMVREDQRRDVSARISYLRAELSRSNIATDERSALIAILADQEQLQAMIMADQRYASKLIVPPYASPIPTSPPSLVKVVVYALVLAVMVWIALVFMGERAVPVRRLIAWSRRTETANGAGRRDPSTGEVIA